MTQPPVSPSWVRHPTQHTSPTFLSSTTNMTQTPIDLPLLGTRMDVRTSSFLSVLHLPHSLAPLQTVPFRHRESGHQLSTLHSQHRTITVYLITPSTVLSVHQCPTSSAWAVLQTPHCHRRILILLPKNLLLEVPHSRQISIPRLLERRRHKPRPALDSE